VRPVFDPPLKPAAPRKSQYNIDPELLEKRAADLPGMASVKVSDLFPELPRSIYSPGDDVKVIRAKTLEALSSVDMSKIKPGDSVNILTSHHGFTLYGGEAYAEMIRTIKDAIEERAGATDIRLRAGVGLRFRETEEYIKKFGLDDYFKGKAIGVAPIDAGVPIETAIGTLYGIKRVYDARWIVHVHNNDVRELHYHRQIGRLFKPFAMSYATIETRSLYHQGLGPRAANFLPRVIFDSDFVQSKFAFSVFLLVTPSGIVGVDADNDLVRQDARVARLNLESYGKIITLLSSIDEVIIVMDYPGPAPYTTAGGILFGNILNATVDEFDLDVGLPPFTRYSDMLYDKKGKPILKDMPPPNPAIKMLIINYCSRGYPGTFFAQQIPTIVVGPMADLLAACEQNPEFMKYALRADNLDAAMAFARRVTGVSNVLAFDGAQGGYNASESLIEFLKREAPRVSEKVDRILMPKWLKQRGLAS